MTKTFDEVIGWDLGGANVKLCRAVRGRPVSVLQLPCPIIADRSKFDKAVDAACQALPAIAGQGVLHAVTMTGELSDVFRNRNEGVGYLVGLMERTFAGRPVLIYGGRAGFLSPEQALEQPGDVASANWHATGALAAASITEGLLVDIGTTTSDIIPLRDGHPAALGYSDGERLTEGELVYTGVVRTPVMALAHRAPWQGRIQGVAAERFATMADVYRLLGILPEDADPYPTADTRGKSPSESAGRLARMLGRDADEAPLDDWVALADWFAGRQLDQLLEAATGLIMRDSIADETPVLGAGAGRFVAETLAARLGRPYCDFATLIEAEPACREMAARAAPCVSVALLACALTVALPEVEI